MLRVSSDRDRRAEPGTPVELSPTGESTNGLDAAAAEPQAAGGGRPGAQALILDDAVHSEGAVGAIVSGLPVLTVVSQGCRPVGHEAVITRCEGNVVYELAGKRASADADLRQALASTLDHARPAGGGLDPDSA